MKLATIQNANGIAFNVRIVEQGERYGHKMQLIHDKADPMVEFYDIRYKFDRDGDIILGQFVSRYNLKTMQSLYPARGLNLEGGVTDWSLDSKAVSELLALFKMWNL